MAYPKFSVLISTYRGDNPIHLAEALQSLVDQSHSPDEVVLVKDGPLQGEANDVIDSFSARLPLTVLDLVENVGLGAALQAGISRCKFDWIARFDSDDLCMPDRFERQLAHIYSHPHLSIVGGKVTEFIEDPTNPCAVRIVPTSHEEIVNVARIRCPFNHVTVMYKRDAVLRAGGYPNYPSYEDYPLWVNMLHTGALSANLPEVLVNVRVGNGLSRRRGGWRYAKSEFLAQNQWRKIGFISNIEFLRNMIMRMPLRLASPSIRQFFYRKALRSACDVAGRAAGPK